MALGEILAFAYDTFSSNKVKFALTALGMVIGTASLILVVTIGLTGKQYVMNQIQAIGANLIYAEYEGGAPRITNVNPDPLTIDDMDAVLAQVPGIAAASPIPLMNACLWAWTGTRRSRAGRLSRILAGPQSGRAHRTLLRPAGFAGA
jgi:putative ABC transport system permease protein